MNRLTSISEKLNGTGNDTFKQSYTFDRWGNRTIDQVNTTANVPHPQYTANASNNRLNAPSGYDPLLYDNAGNLTQDSTSQNPTTVMLYDAENRLLSPQVCFPNGEGGETCDVDLTTYKYVYDGDSRRVRRTHTTTYGGGVTSWDETWQVYGMDGELLAEYPQYGPSMALAQPQKEYGYRNGQLLVTAEPWENVALHRPATQIDTFENGTRTADRAVNGDANGGFNTGSVSATTSHLHSWWQVDLQSVKTIDSITVWGRSDCCHEMTSDFYVLVSDTPFTSYDLDTTLSQSGVYSYRYFDFAGPASIPVNRTGRYVRVQLAGTQYLVLGEVQVWSAAAKVNWLVTDHLGTPRMVVDKTGAASGITRHDYLPFGEELFADTGGRTTTQGYSASDNVRQKFTQKERDNETGLDFFEARYYASTQGRFTGVDPFNIVLEAQEERDPRKGQSKLQAYLSQPQQWNRYSYAINNPLLYVDPTGEAIKLSDDKDEREAQMQALREAVGAEAGAYLYVNQGDDGNYYVGISDNSPSGGSGSFGQVNDVARQFSHIITDSQVATLELVGRGNVTDDSGSTMFIGRASRAGGESPAATGYFKGQLTIKMLDWRKHDMGYLPGELMSDGKDNMMTKSVLVAHELRHAWDLMCGITSKYDSNQHAVDFENKVRVLQFPKGPTRVRHNPLPKPGSL